MISGNWGVAFIYILGGAALIIGAIAPKHSNMNDLALGLFMFAIVLGLLSWFRS